MPYLKKQGRDFLQCVSCICGSCICDLVVAITSICVIRALFFPLCVFSQLLLFRICPVCVQYLSSEYLSSICDRQVWCSEEGPLIWPSYKVSARHRCHGPPPATAPDSLTTHNSYSHAIYFPFRMSYFGALYFCILFCSWLRAWKTKKEPSRLWTRVWNSLI